MEPVFVFQQAQYNPEPVKGSLAAGSFGSSFSPAISAINWSIWRRFKWKLLDFFSAIGTFPVSFMHLAFKTPSFLKFSEGHKMKNLLKIKATFLPLSRYLVWALATFEKIIEDLLKYSTCRSKIHYTQISQHVKWKSLIALFSFSSSFDFSKIILKVLTASPVLSIINPIPFSLK